MESSVQASRRAGVRIFTRMAMCTRASSSQASARAAGTHTFAVCLISMYPRIRCIYAPVVPGPYTVAINREYRWSNGDVYMGGWKHGDREGEGTLRHENGAVYQGGWKADQREGKGKLTHSNGDTYEGGFSAGKKNGRGKATYSSGAEYDGEYIEDKKCGKGTQCSNGDVYTGSIECSIGCSIEYSIEGSAEGSMQESSSEAKCRGAGDMPMRMAMCTQVRSNVPSNVPSNDPANVLCRRVQHRPEARYRSGHADVTG